MGGSIDRYVVAVPWMIVAVDHCLPSRQHKTGYVARARFDSTPMLHKVRTLRFDLHNRHARPHTDISPRISREHPWIHGVANDRLAEAQTVSRDRVGCAITGVFQITRDARFAHGLLDGVYAQPNGAELRGKRTSKSRFSRAR